MSIYYVLDLSETRAPEAIKFAQNDKGRMDRLCEYLNVANGYGRYEVHALGLLPYPTQPENYRLHYMKWFSPDHEDFETLKDAQGYAMYAEGQNLMSATDVEYLVTGEHFSYYAPELDR